MCIVVGESRADKNGCAYVTNSRTKARARDEARLGKEWFSWSIPVVKDRKDRKTAARWPLTRAKGERPGDGGREKNERNGDGEIICHGGQTNP